MNLRIFAGVALVVAGAGIVIQIAAGAPYPAIPPGLVILIVAAALTVSVDRRWIMLVPILVGVFMLVGAVLTDDAANSLAAGGIARPGGVVLQLAAVLVALGAASIGLLRRTRGAPM